VQHKQLGICGGKHILPATTNSTHLHNVYSRESENIYSIASNTVTYPFDISSYYPSPKHNLTPQKINQTLYLPYKTKMVKVGDKAPNFSLQDQNGNTVTLADEIGKHYLIIYFYPKDFTPGCTQEACEFRDRYESFSSKDAEALNTKIYGISCDNVETHKKFQAKYKLPYDLLADEGVSFSLFGLS
jgi:peroxiredoxin